MRFDLILPWRYIAVFPLGYKGIRGAIGIIRVPKMKSIFHEV